MFCEFASPDKHPYSAKTCLPWSYREPRILERLAAYDPDVIFLQEMQLDVWDSFLAKLPGFTGLLQERKNADFPVNAVLIRNEWGQVLRTESRSRALIVVVQTTLSDKPLYLANVHLQAGFQEDETRYFQIRSLMKRLEHHQQEFGSSSSNNGDGDDDNDDESSKSEALIMAGDFNMVNNNDDVIYDLLTVGHLPDDVEEDLVADTLPQPLLPLLPLRDAYRHCPPVVGPVLMTHRGGSVLDYIWLSDAVHIEETWQSHPAAAVSLRRTWPSHTQPSDHLPVGAVLSLKKTS